MKAIAFLLYAFEMYFLIASVHVVFKILVHLLRRKIELRH
jgi:hypothetical protein